MCVTARLLSPRLKTIIFFITPFTELQQRGTKGAKQGRKKRQKCGGQGEGEKVDGEVDKNKKQKETEQELNRLREPD